MEAPVDWKFCTFWRRVSRSLWVKLHRGGLDC